MFFFLKTVSVILVRCSSVHVFRLVFCFNRLFGAIKTWLTAKTDSWKGRESRPTHDQFLGDSSNNWWDVSVWDQSGRRLDQHINTGIKKKKIATSMAESTWLYESMKYHITTLTSVPMHFFCIYIHSYTVAGKNMLEALAKQYQGS